MMTFFVRLGLLLFVAVLPVLGEEAEGSGSPWAAIEARAAAFTGTGYSQEKAALVAREVMKGYYASQYPKWTDPEPAPVPEGKLRNLPNPPVNPRFILTDKIWTTTPGSASVCLWEDDKLAAFSFSVDDNQAPDVPFWLELSKKYGGLNITWNLISGYVNGNISPGRLVLGGRWDLWENVRAEGHHIASH
ncbi:MAG TPA: hypothetical protein VIM58_08690, partial [Candidatus Methylacidiphilales bacterium]